MEMGHKLLSHGTVADILSLSKVRSLRVIRFVEETARSNLLIIYENVVGLSAHVSFVTYHIVGSISIYDDDYCLL
jgi:hypothetical protein